MTLRLKGSSTGDVSLKAPATAGDNTITLPTSNGSADQFLMNSGTAGELEFASLASSDMPTGSILQVKQTIKTSTFSTTTDGFTDVTGLSVDITPTSNSTKMLVMTAVNFAHSGGNRTAARVVRRVSSTDNVISQADDAANRVRSMWLDRHQQDTGASNQVDIQILDSHGTTDPITYKFQEGRIDAGTLQINYGYSDTNSSSHAVGISTITVMEVAA